MRIESYRFWAALAAAYLVGCSVAFVPAPAEAGTLVIPAWSFARGNAVIHTDPSKYADAGPIVTSGEEEDRQPWGWTVEYDVDFPVEGKYQLHIQYASGETRPIEVFFDARNVSKGCTGISLRSGSSGAPSWKSSHARWETLLNRFGAPAAMAANRKEPTKAGMHTITLTSRESLPHLVALRLETPEPFPEDWKPPQFKVRDINRIPAKYRTAFKQPSKMDVAALRKPVVAPPKPRVAGKLEIPAWAFDRGNVRIYASPDQYANAEPVIGSEAGQTGQTMVEYDIDFPATGDYTLTTKYASAEARPLEIFVEGKSRGACCNSVAFNSPPNELPIVTSDDSWDAKTETSVTIPITKGKRTLKFARNGPFPHLVSLKLTTSAELPKDWKQPPRVMRQLDQVPPREHSVFLPPDAVNMAALRLAIEDTIKTYGSQYPGGPGYLKRLAEFEKRRYTVTAVKPVQRSFLMARTWAGEENLPEEQRKVEAALKTLRQEAMLAHPAMKFDKLLFLKRTPYSAHIYEDQHHVSEGGNIYMLSPVTPNGKLTKLVPELDGGLFGRFDLSFDGTKVVFCYKKAPEPEVGTDGKKKQNTANPFHLYEIRLDPSTGQRIPGSLRQLTFDDNKGTGPLVNINVKKTEFHDSDPCYLPNGKIIFVSSRSQRNVFCFPTTVSTLHIMDGDGKNMRCLSAGPLTEMGPTLLNDGRIVYTRWEYVDKGLGNGQGVWSIRPDGSAVDHVYKNSTMRPSGMIHTRSIPGSQRLVTVANPHCGRAGGAVILIDNRKTRRTTAAMSSLTPEIAYPCMYQSTWHMGYFLTPYPFSEKFFLTSHQPGSTAKEKKKYGIYALDAWGNRALLYEDPEISCFEPMPLRPRPVPATVSPTALVKETRGDNQDEEGTLFVQDVYEGMKGIERGRVKYLRVMGVLPWPWDQNGIFHLGVSVHRKKVYGVAKVHEDGSAQFQVPAGENIFVQALDENYMQLQHMPTFINMKAGEKRSCVGCHEHRRKAPGLARARPLALDVPAQTLAPQPGDKGPRMVHYPVDVQPMLEKHCVKCHSGDNAKGRLDLVDQPTELFSRTFDLLVGRRLISYRNVGFGRSQYRPQAPLSYGSHLSKMVERIQTGDPCKAKLTQEEFIRFVTWIDANAPYYGTYRGKRDLKDKDDPDFRLPPLVQH